MPCAIIGYDGARRQESTDDVSREKTFDPGYVGSYWGWFGDPLMDLPSPEIVYQRSHWRDAEAVREKRRAAR